MRDACLFDGFLLNLINIVMVEKPYRRDSHGSTIPERPVFKYDSAYLMPFQPGPERQDSLEGADGVAPCKIAMETELLRDVFRIDSVCLNDGFGQGECHVRVVGVISGKLFRKIAQVKRGPVWTHPFEASPKGISQKTSEDGPTEFVAKNLMG